MNSSRTAFPALLVSCFFLLCGSAEQTKNVATVQIGSRLELFVDHSLIEQMHATRLELSRPSDRGIALRFDKPWEGAFCAYATVIKDDQKFRLYYRGLADAGEEGKDKEVTCYAESRDGVNWTKPDLGLFELMGTRQNNIILAHSAPLTTNFSPMLDSRPGVPSSEKFKALAGNKRSGLFAFVSGDGIRWKKLRDQPVFTKGAFDSQNHAFWSEIEQRYVCYFRTFKEVNGDRVRWISRTISEDFINWREPVEMNFGGSPAEHLYTNQTHPYFRAPHIYIGLAARLVPGCRVLSDAQVQAIGVHPAYAKDCSDSVLLTSRGGDVYDRTFMEAFLRPEIGAENWTSRTNYPALNVIPTGPAEMSFYVQRGYGQPNHHLRRYTLPLDRFASVHSTYQGGEFVTRPVTFAGDTLFVNFATSAPGRIRVEIQDLSRKPIPGFTLAESVQLTGNEIERAVSWSTGQSVALLAGQPVRLRFVMKDADLYALRFR